MGSFLIKGKDKAVIIIRTLWKRIDNDTLLYIVYLLVSESNATFEKPDPDNLPIISITLP